MKYICRSFLILAALLFFSDISGASRVIKPQEGNFALFKEAEFYPRGHYQISGEAFHDRDLNRYNGNNESLNFLTGTVERDQTIELESYLQHELYFGASMELYEGKVCLHTKFHTGGYMWETFTPSFVEGGGQTVANRALSTGDTTAGGEILDFEKIRTKQLFLELETPAGLFLGGRLPGNMHGVNWIVPLFIIPDWIVAFTYAKLSETQAYTKVFDETKYVGYTDVNKASNDYLDRDDQTIRGFTLRFAKKKGYSGSISLMNIKYGGGDPTYITDEYSFGINFNYKKEDLTINTYFRFVDGHLADLSIGEVGGLFLRGVNALNATARLVDLERYKLTNWQPGVISFDKCFSFGVHAFKDIGRFTPEFDFHYCKGPNGWDDGGASLPSSLDSEDIDIDGKVGAYLLSDIESKYIQLLPTPTMTLAGIPPDAYSYQNIILIKSGTTYRINDNFAVYGQIVGAWRQNTEYYEKDYWDVFGIWNATTTLQRIPSESDPSKLESILAAVFQLRDVEYYQDIDNFMGVELDSEFTWIVHKGVELSLLASYLKPGNFFKDVLTPKEYAGLLINMDTMEGASDVTEIYGPYLAAPVFELADTWMVQLKVDFKFQ